MTDCPDTSMDFSHMQHQARRFDLGRRTYPTYEALRVPQGVESRDVVLQDGLTAALTAGSEQSEEALLTVLLAITVMETCARDTLTR